MKTQKEQQDEKRVTKLAELERQVENGSLVVRQMTPGRARAQPAAAAQAGRSRPAALTQARQPDQRPTAIASTGPRGGCTRYWG